MIDMMTVRRPAPVDHKLSLLDEIFVEPGTKEDWELLHELHYKAENLAAGPKYWKCTLRERTIGVGVITNSQFLSKYRNKLFKHMKPNQNGRDNKMINQFRAEEMNRMMRTNSRLVLDNIYRGAGISYRMQNLMMRMSGERFIEFQSSMSKFNPFAAKSGIQFLAPERSVFYEKGLNWFARWFDSYPTDKAGILEELEAMPPFMKNKCIAEMRQTYYRFSAMEKSGDNRMNGTSRVDGLPIPKLLEQLQQVVFASPLYGLYINPDYERELPERIPIKAFDYQKPNEPLRLDLLQ